MQRMRNWRWLGQLFFKIILPAAIIIAVGWQFASILRRPELQGADYNCRLEWLIPAGLLYLAAHSIWAAFWVSLLRHQGFHASYPTGLRAYFVSQYGKYIPGKVWVIVIRVVMLGGSRKDRTIVGVTATYEALTSMAAGAIIGAILLPVLNIDLLGFGAKNYVLIPIAVVPLAIGVCHRLFVRIAQKRLGPDARAIPSMSLLLLVRGLLQASVGWMLLGLSVWMIVQAVRPELKPFYWEDWIRLTTINSLSYVLGFIVLIAPAGGGVREWVLKVLLFHELVSSMPEPYADGLAVIIALVVRLVWTTAELILALLLYRFIPATKRPPLAPAVLETSE